MALLTGITAAGLEVPVQVLPDGKLVAEGLEGPLGPIGPEGPPGRDGPVGPPGQINQFAPGSTALPGLAVVGYPKTGIYSPSPNHLGFVTDGQLCILINNTGVLGIGPGGTSSDVHLRLTNTFAGAGAKWGVYHGGEVKASVTGAAFYFGTQAATESASFTLPSLSHYHAYQGVFGAGSKVTAQYGFVASSSLAGAVNNYGFFSDILPGTGHWSFYSQGRADSLFASNNFVFANGGTEKARFDANGRLLMGRSFSLAGSVSQLQATGTINITTATHADNAAAKAGGLVAGDIYRKADGTLMITF